MIRKKVASLITAAVVMATCLGTSVPNIAYAKGAPAKVTERFNSIMRLKAEKAKISEDEALQTIISSLKTYFNLSINIEDYNISYDFSNGGANGDYIWSIQLTKAEKGSRQSIQASIDANTGEVVSLRQGNYSDDGSNATGGYPRAKAKQNAVDFLNKFFGDKAKELQSMDNNLDIYNSGNYYYDFSRVENGVLCSGDYLNLEVDSTTGNVVGFDYSWDKNLKAPDTSKVIASSKAAEIFRKNTDAQLKYISFTDKYKYNGASDAQDTKLVYDISGVAQGSIDANSGKYLNNLYSGNAVVVTKDLTEAQKQAWLKKAGTPVNHDAEIDQTAAKKVIARYVKTFYGTGYTVEDLSYSKDSTSNYYGTNNGIWRANFYKKSSKNGDRDFNSIAIDAKTETIVDLYSNKEDNIKDSSKKSSKKSSNITLDKAYNEALDVIAKYYPGIMKQIDTKQTYVTTKGEDEGKYYNFSFTRSLNGIPYYDDSITISIARDKGIIQNLNLNWNSSLKYRLPDVMKNKNEILDIALAKYTPVLTYSMVNGKYSLSYVLMNKDNDNSYYYIDASSGKFLDYSGYNAPEVTQDFLNKIKNSQYADTLTELAYRGIIDTATFDPTKSITKIDFFKMLVNARGYDTYALSNATALNFKDVANGSADYKYLQLAVYYGFLDNTDGNFDENAPISREDIAVTFMKVLGYSNIVKNNDIFKLTTSDAASVDPAKLGAVAMADGLGILKVNNNTIRPKDNATMEEAAVGIYSTINQIQR